nr:hypothetical protein CFP56_69402 [Quercus suber]
MGRTSQSEWRIPTEIDPASGPEPEQSKDKHRVCWWQKCSSSGFVTIYMAFSTTSSAVAAPTTTTESA